jgi:uncharacterized repeat protein (TIGR03803 family)
MKKNLLRGTWVPLAWVAMLALAGCGGGSGGGGGGGGSPSPTSYSIGGSVSGLSSGQSVTLLNNGADPVTVGANGAFSFSTSMATGNAYAVTVQTQTAGVACSIAGASGAVGSSNVTSVVVTCVAGYTVGGTVYGLSGGESITLLSAGEQALVLSASGTFTFSPALPTGTGYEIIELPEPTSSVPCSIVNGSGTVGSANVTNVIVSCATLGGTISGLSSGESVTLLNNGGYAMTFTKSGPFAFSSVFAFGSTYHVTIQTQTPGIKCSVADGSGTMGATNVTSIAVSCIPTDTVLHSFGGTATDGQTPYAGLIMDSAGNLYGTTTKGGVYSYGTVFEISAAGVETVLHSFAGNPTDGLGPNAGLIMDSAGNLYGTTVAGGEGVGGAMFKIDATGTESLLHSFGLNFDVFYPYSSLIMDSAGNFYGTASDGSGNQTGGVFKITTTGTETVLYAFGLPPDGQTPESALVMDSAGNLYGTASNGGAHNDGIVFKISPTGTETILYSFSGSPDGRYPWAPLVMDSAGNLYGTTKTGGQYGQGTVFELSAGGTERVLYSFGSTPDDGGGPDSGLLMDSAGNFYGVTPYGGANQAGVVFKLSPNGTETVLHIFGAGPDGQNPEGSLMMDSAGHLYGTTARGGAYGYGTVYKVN